MDEIRLIAKTHEMACNLSKQNFNLSGSFSNSNSMAEN